MKINFEAILKTFTNRIRWNLAEPFYSGEWTAATDGHRLCAVKSEIFKGEYANRKGPQIDGIFKYATWLKKPVEIPLSNLTFDHLVALTKSQQNKEYIWLLKGAFNYAYLRSIRIAAKKAGNNNITILACAPNDVLIAEAEPFRFALMPLRGCRERCAEEVSLTSERPTKSVTAQDS